LTKYAYSYNQNKTLCTRIRTASRKSTSVLLHLPNYWWAGSVFHDIFVGFYLVRWREQSTLRKVRFVLIVIHLRIYTQCCKT